MAGVAAGGTALIVGGAVWASSAIAAPSSEPTDAPATVALIRVTMSPEPRVTVTATPEPVVVRVTVTPEPVVVREPAKPSKETEEPKPRPTPTVGP